MRRLAIGSALLMTALLLGGCSAAPSDEHVPTGPEVGAPEGVPDGEDASGGQDGAIVDLDRDVVITGNVVITTEDPLAAATEAVRIVEAAGGRIDRRVEYAATDRSAGSAQLTLRVPADDLSDVLDRLRELGRADEVNLSSDDVTVQVTDLEARIAALQSSVDRLTELLATATDVEQLIVIENQLTTRQAELESLQAQQRVLADQIAMSTISLTLRSDQAAPDVVPDDFWGGLVTGWNAFVGVLAGLLVGLGFLAPWLAVAGIGALIVLLVIRLTRRGRRPDGSAPSAG